MDKPEPLMTDRDEPALPGSAREVEKALRSLYLVCDAVVADEVNRIVRAEIERLTAELERERMRLAACGVVAMANTRASAVEARKMHDDYRSASCDAVASAVDREMDWRERAEAAQEYARRYRWLRQRRRSAAGGSDRA